MNKGIKFNFGNKTFAFSDEMVKYAELKNHGTQEAVKSSIRFCNTYDKYENLDEFCRDGYANGLQLIKNAIDQAVQCCVDEGLYDVNDKVFMDADENGFIVEPWEKAFKLIYDTWVDLESEKLSEEQRRAFRKEARGRFVGGGFGLSNAIMASVEAGAVNIVTGAAHSAFNAIGNAITSHSINNRKEKIFRDEATLTALQLGVYESVDRVFTFLCGAILHLHPFDDSRIPEERTHSMMDNILHGRIPANQQDRVLCDILQSNPFLRTAYRQIALGDQLNTLSDIVSFYHMKRFFGITQKECGEEMISSHIAHKEEEAKLWAGVADGHGQQAVELSKMEMEKGNLDESRELLLEAVSLGDNNAIRLYARQLEEENKNGRAQNLILLKDLYAILEKKNDLETLLVLADKYEDGSLVFPQNIEKAKSYYKKVISLDKKGKFAAEAAYQMVRILEAEGDNKGAFEYYGKVLTCGKKKALYHFLNFISSHHCDYIRAYDFLRKYLGVIGGVEIARAVFDMADDGKIVKLQGQISPAGAVYSIGILCEAIFNDEKGISQRDAAKFAVAFYKIALELGYGQAAYRLGLICEEQAKRSKDYSQTITYYEKALQMHSHGNAAQKLAAIYSDQNLSVFSAAKALQYYEKAYANGAEEDAYLIAQYYDNPNYAFHDITKAMNYYSIASNHGNGYASYRMGVLCEGTDGVARNISNAVQYYKIASDQGCKEASFRLGQLYEASQSDLPQNQEESAAWYSKAYEQGMMEASFALGLKYQSGLGVPQDLDKAKSFLETAVRYQFNQAQIYLGMVCEQKNELVEAERWYTAAANTGNQEAVQRLADLKNNQNLGVEKKKQADEQAARQKKAEAQRRQDARARAMENAIDNTREAASSVWHWIVNAFLVLFFGGYLIMLFITYYVKGDDDGFWEFFVGTFIMYIKFIFGFGAHLLGII